MRKFSRLRVAVILAVASTSAMAGGRGAFVILQNATPNVLTVSSSSNCIYGAGGLNMTLPPASVRQVYIEASNSWSCSVQRSTGTISISLGANKSTVSYTVSSGTTSAGVGVTGLLNNQIFTRAFSKNTYSRTSDQDLIIVNLTPTSTVTSSSWMANNQMKLANKKLTEILLPGTHDSFGYDLSSSTICSSDPNASSSARIPNFGLAFAKTQDLSFIDQLNRGIRYFDVRLCLNNGRVFATHSLITNHTIDELTSGLDTYLAQHPKEVVILDFNHVFGFDSGTLTNYLATFYSKYQRYIVDYRNNTQQSTLSEIWGSGRNLVVVLPRDFSWLNANGLPWAWPSNSIVSNWSSNVFSSTDYNTILAYDFTRLNGRASDKMLVSQMQFTPDSNFITYNLSKNLEFMAYSNLAAMDKWVSLNSSQINIYERDYSLGFDGYAEAVSAIK